MSVVVDWKSLERTSRLLGGGEWFLLFRPDEGVEVSPDVLNSALHYAVEPANNGDWFETPHGWVVYADNVDKQELEGLAASIVATTEAAGWSGKIVAPPAARSPRWAGYNPPLSIMAFYEVSPHVKDRFKHKGWGGDPAVYPQILTALKKYISCNAKNIQILFNSLNLNVSEETFTRLFAERLEVGLRARAASYADDRSEYRDVSIGDLACVEFDINRVDKTTAFSTLKETLFSLPRQSLLYAAIFHHTTMNLPVLLRMTGIDLDRPVWLPLDCLKYKTFGPQGIQILSPRHLKSISNLEDWNVTELETNWFAVEAKDMDAWYLPKKYLDVDADLRGNAMRDFSQVVITPNDLRRILD